MSYLDFFHEGYEADEGKVVLLRILEPHVDHGRGHVTRLQFNKYASSLIKYAIMRAAISRKILDK
jgi:hypothetical protein